MVKLTIVIPIYNAEKYLDRCLNSLLCQNAKDYELLLVDDGSKDNSGKICDEYAKKYEHIKVFHKPNGGVSSARNLGIDEAQGEYITFIDADDFVSLNYFVTVFDYINNKKTDCLLFNLFREKPDGKFLSQRLPIAEGNHEDPDQLIQYSVAYYSFVNGSSTKIHKTNIIRENNLRFNENIKLCEDNIFSLDYIACIKNFTICDAPMYFYAINEGSATQKRKLQYFADDEFLFFKYENLINTKNREDLSMDLLYETYLRRCFYNIDNLTKQKIKKETIRRALVATTMCNVLLKYKYKRNPIIRAIKKRLYYFSKGRWVSYAMATFVFKVVRHLRSVLKILFVKPVKYLIREFKYTKGDPNGDEE